MRLQLPVILLCFMAASTHAREWTDSTGHYHVEADLIGSNEKTAILKKPNRQLVYISFDKFSTADEEYLKSEEAAAKTRKLSQSQQTWTRQSGRKVSGTFGDYAR